MTGKEHNEPGMSCCSRKQTKECWGSMPEENGSKHEEAPTKQIGNNVNIKITNDRI
jgi:hypothetical protein